MTHQLEQAILQEIVYFDLFSYPLTTLEIWGNLDRKVALSEIESALKESAVLARRVASKNGMWFLKGREDAVMERQKRYRASKRKLDLARQYAHRLTWVPFVQALYACNSLGFLHARPESDIDLFIVARRGRIWSARFFAVLLAKLLFRRPSAEQAKDGLCLSFFAASGAHLQTLTLPGGDVYYDHWLNNLLPLWKRPAISARDSDTQFGKLLETILRKIQWKMLPANLKALANKGTSVVVSDKFLKFHDHDRREYYRREWKARLAEVGA